MNTGIGVGLLFEIRHIHYHGIGRERGAVLKFYPLAKLKLINMIVYSCMRDRQVVFPATLIIGGPNKTSINGMRYGKAGRVKTPLYGSRVF